MRWQWRDSSVGKILRGANTIPNEVNNALGNESTCGSWLFCFKLINTNQRNYQIWRSNHLSVYSCIYHITHHAASLASRIDAGQKVSQGSTARQEGKGEGMQESEESIKNSHSITDCLPASHVMSDPEWSTVYKKGERRHRSIRKPPLFCPYCSVLFATLEGVRE